MSIKKEFPREVMCLGERLTVYGVYTNNNNFYIYSEEDVIGVVLINDCKELPEKVPMDVFDVIKWWNEQVYEGNSPACKNDGEMYFSLPHFRFLREQMTSKRIRFTSNFNEDIKDSDFIIFTKDVE